MKQCAWNELQQWVEHFLLLKQAKCWNASERLYFPMNLSILNIALRLCSRSGVPFTWNMQNWWGFIICLFPKVNIHPKLLSFFLQRRQKSHHIWGMFQIQMSHSPLPTHSLMPLYLSNIMFYQSNFSYSKIDSDIIPLAFSTGFDFCFGGFLGRTVQKHYKHTAKEGEQLGVLYFQGICQMTIREIT